MAQGLRGSVLVTERNVAELDGRSLVGTFRNRAVCHRKRQVENALHAAGACERLRQRQNQVRHLDQLDENLRHIVVKRNHGALAQQSGINPERADIDEHEKREINHYIGEGVHQSGDAPDKELLFREGFVARIEFAHLFLFLAERPQHADAA